MSVYIFFTILDSLLIDLFILILLTFQVQNGMTDFSRFQRVVKLLAFHPFDSAEHALENMNAVSEHQITEDLRVRTYFKPLKIN